MAGPREEAEEGLAAMLETLAEVSGMEFGEIMASEGEKTLETLPGEDAFFTGDLTELEDTVEDEIDVDNRHSSDFGDYLDALFDDMDVDMGENDSYADAEI